MPSRAGRSFDSDTGSGRSDGSGKERLKWTDELHDLFEKAVNQLGGPDSKFKSYMYKLFGSGSGSGSDSDEVLLRSFLGVNSGRILSGCPGWIYFVCVFGVQGLHQKAS